MDPARTLTFLFTDIEGSTRLWERHPAEMREALARHDELVAQAIAAHGGRVFRRVGDAFCAAFARASDAVLAAAAVQRALFGEPWGVIGDLRVRIGVYAGEAEQYGEDYVGPCLNRLARLLATALGGQVLIAGGAYSLLGEASPDGLAHVDLGWRKLRDVPDPERVYQLAISGLTVPGRSSAAISPRRRSAHRCGARTIRRSLPR